MKKVMPYFLLRSLRTIFKLAIFAFLASITQFAYSQSFKGSEINVLKSKRPSLVLFSSNNTCNGCYEELGKIINAISESRADFSFIVYIGYIEDPKLRREFVKRYSIFKYADTIIFENFESLTGELPAGGLFANFEIYHTPAILLLSQNETSFMGYQEIFGSKNSFNKARKRIKSFMKKAR